MPELPEVETIRRQLAPRLTGASIERGWGFASPKFDDAPDAAGHDVQRVRRRGKYLLVDLHPDGSDGAAQVPRRPAGRELVIHLGMTGRLAVTDGPPSPHPHLRAWWALQDGHTLTFHDARRFGRIAVVDAGRHDALPTLAALGPEPLSADFTPSGLRAGLSGRRALKTVLMGQRVVAGLGNIYADEALWLARISPFSRRLSAERATRLHGSIVEVLTRAVDNGGTTLRDYRDATGGIGANQSRLECYGRGGLPCARCGERLSHRALDARTTTWCGNCQT